MEVLLLDVVIMTGLIWLIAASLANESEAEKRRTTHDVMLKSDERSGLIGPKPLQAA